MASTKATGKEVIPKTECLAPRKVGLMDAIVDLGSKIYDEEDPSAVRTYSTKIRTLLAIQKQLIGGQ
jgi:hypothetical protein